MKRSPFPVPYGWFQVGWATDVAVGETKPLRYFGKHQRWAQFTIYLLPKGYQDRQFLLVVVLVQPTLIFYVF